MDSFVREQIGAILTEGQDLTLAALRPDGAPQATPVSSAADGLDISFGCGAHSRKARHQGDGGDMALLRIVPPVVSAPDCSKSFGRTDLVTPDAADAAG